MSSLLFALLVPGPPGSPRATLRDRTADVVAVLSALAYGALMVPLGDATSVHAAIPWQADVAIGLACTPALLARRRRPLAVCLALLPFGVISVMATGPILVALFTVAIRRRARLVLVLAAVHVLTGVVYYALQHDPPFDLWVDLLMRAVTGLAAVGWGLFLKAYRHLTSSLRAEAENAQAQAEMRMERARLTERARIAREMHDVLAHRMSMVSLHAGALEVRTDATPDEIATAARAIRVSAHLALEELRSVIGILRQPATTTGIGAHSSGVDGRRADAYSNDDTDVEDASRAGPSMHDTIVVLGSLLGPGTSHRGAEGDTGAHKVAGVGLVGGRGDDGRRRHRGGVRVEPPQPRFSDLPDLLTEARSSGMKIDVWVAPRSVPSEELERTAYRVVQEGLTNARKHAPGGDVEVRLDGGGDRDLRILVTNSLLHEPGGDEVPGSGTGLTGVGERVALAGGRVEYGAEDGRFRLEAWLPCNQ
ncbi:sensor histidine kinase [Paractinoplanes brasiliensis]|uniref:histidine kinase n=1 Tax=Paractinoplanes brasiliensis TaxID=52695 RepID=A0A4R6JRC0_9ACTN|nr:sensor histidine kinase [Actinoplanes brasiliensis]TDO37456.1 histidine kinase [Actinoplanes brasiliensis]GID29226.1 two-component sensor histidine kinase [Actinoplanes brasiliensis]